MSDRDCPFCKIAKRELPAVIVQEDHDLMVVMDLYPATAGHVLVIPKLHIENIYSLPDELGVRVMVTAMNISTAIKQSLSPDGLNLIQANGLADGQTIQHFHLHIVPRYGGDSVRIKFGHGPAPAVQTELARMASVIRSRLSGR